MVDHTIAGVGARTWAARCAAELAFVSGDDETAERWTAKIDDAFWQPVGRARSLLARLDHEAALAALDDAVPRCSRHDVVLALHRAMATRAHEEALKHAIAAVETAVEFGMVRTVVAQGPTAVELVERCAWRAPVGWLDRVRRAAVAAGTVEVASRGAQAERRVPREPLTERERDVLRFLPSRLTLPEIANELYISMNTLKFHLKVIYRKLGVASRADAAEAARQMTTIRS
jgi:LuxR family maltose regulon positive regulatory protein